MVIKKPRIVIIGAGMAGLTAANKLYRSHNSNELFELCVVEGGTRIGGRINTSEFDGDLIELGATWIHGINGSPVHQIAQEINSLESEHPWESMDSLDDPLTIAEGGYEVNPSLVELIHDLFNKLMDFSQGKLIENGVTTQDILNACVNGGAKRLGMGAFLRKGLENYWKSVKDREEVTVFGNWRRKSLEEAIFSMLENVQREYTSADDLNTLDYTAESEYRMFPGEEITIAKGYFSIIEYIANVLPPGTIQLEKKVSKIEWQGDDIKPFSSENGHGHGHKSRPVKLYFDDGSTMSADHVIVTVSLGVLKQETGLFSPSLPSFKTQAISRLGFGVVNKLFLQLESEYKTKFPYLQMVFHQSDPKQKHPKIPWWIRKTASISPIHSNSSVLLSWFAGKEAIELESLTDEEIINGISDTVSNFLSDSPQVKFTNVLKSQWGTNPLFLGSYSYVAVGSSGDDLEIMAEPLPRISNSISPPLQILFAGEATHRTHYSTTHGAYYSGLREANRLLQHYKFVNGV